MSLPPGTRTVAPANLMRFARRTIESLIAHALAGDGRAAEG